MALVYRFTCPLPNGIHARPASALEEVARTATADVTFVNARTGHSANAKSVLAVVGLDVRRDDPCELRVEGEDEDAALLRLRRFLEDEFPNIDEPLTTPEEGQAVTLPPMLRDTGALVIPGTAVVPGFGRGQAVFLDELNALPSLPAAASSDPAGERDRLRAALRALVARYDSRLEALPPGVEADVLRAHRSVARDPEFHTRLETSLDEEHATAAAAIAAAEQHFTSMLRATGSALLRERALDVRDVCRELLHEIYGEHLARAAVVLPDRAVCVAETLTPGEFLALDRSRLAGLVLAHGGTTSHTVILARSFGIPTLVGVEGVGGMALGDVIVDGDLGILVTAITPPVRRYYEMESRRLAERQDWLSAYTKGPVATRDGRRLEVAANVATAAESSQVFERGADGIGLFRTEMLFMDRHEAPSEEEQFEAYRTVLRAAQGKPVIVRTLDIGGDKPLSYLRLPREDNPFLGYRAVRVYPEFEGLFRAQLRAIIRASAFGAARLMVPMIATASEARWVRATVREEQSRLVAAGVAFDANMPVGAMLEVPAAVFQVKALSAHLDFFSIGTNDLLQYFMAVDRANERVAGLYDTRHPAFLALLKLAVDQSHAAGRWIGLCGEMGGQRALLPLLVGLGLDEISLAAPSIAGVKADLASLSASECDELLAEALACATPAEVTERLEAFASRRPAPLVDATLVTLHVEATTKAEAIKAAVDRLFVTGRTTKPRLIEDAVWRREAEYSTGFGNGFAIPHCKTDAVASNSLVVVRLAGSVDWGALDGQPVGFLILLAIRESDHGKEHLRVLAALARKLMHEEFRERLLAEDDPARLCEILRETTGGSPS